MTSRVKELGMDYTFYDSRTQPPDVRVEVNRSMINKSSDNVRNAVRHAYQIHTALSPSQHAELAAMFSNRYVFTDHSRYSPHPIAHALLEIATHISYDQALNRLNDQGIVKPFIEIGGAISKVSNLARDKNIHSCHLHNGVRDAHRIVEQADSLPYNEYLRNQLLQNLHANIPMMGSFCGGCTSRCTFKAGFGIAIHSIYDMTPLDMYLTFLRHELDNVTATIHLPKELHYAHASMARKYSGIHNNYTFEIIRDKALMHFNDGTAGYLHGLKNWRFWATASGIIGPEFSISIQVSAVHGYQYMLHLCRIPNNLRDFPSRFAIADYMSQYILIPDIFEYVQLPDHLNKKTQILVPTDFYNRLFQYTIKVEIVTISSIYMFACSIASRIDIASYTVNREWAADANVFFRATYSIIFIALASRREARNNSQAIFDIIDDQEDYNYMPLKSRIKRLFTKLKDGAVNIMPWTKSSFDKSYSNDTDILHCFEPMYFDNIRYDEVAHLSKLRTAWRIRRTQTYDPWANAPIIAAVADSDTDVETDSSDDESTKVFDVNNKNMHNKINLAKQKLTTDNNQPVLAGIVNHSTDHTQPNGGVNVCSSDPKVCNQTTGGKPNKVIEHDRKTDDYTMQDLSADLTHVIIKQSLRCIYDESEEVDRDTKRVLDSVVSHISNALAKDDLERVVNQQINADVANCLNDVISNVELTSSIQSKHPECFKEPVVTIDSTMNHRVKIEREIQDHHPGIKPHVHVKYIYRKKIIANDPKKNIVWFSPSNKPNFTGKDEIYQNAIKYLPSYRIKNKCLTKLNHILFNTNTTLKGNGIDIGCAPGGWSSLLPNCDAITGPFKMDNRNVKNYRNVFEMSVEDFDEKGRNYDYLLCDIGDQDASLKVYDRIFEIMDETEPNVVIYKCWTEFEDLYNIIGYFATNYKQIACIKPFGSGDLNNEFYIVAHNRETLEELPIDFTQSIVNEVWCINETIAFACREAMNYVPHDVYMKNLKNVNLPVNLEVSDLEISTAIRFYNNIKTSVSEKLEILQDEVSRVKNKVMVHSITGIGGCGKSKDIAELYKREARDCMIVVPTNSLKEEFSHDSRFSNWKVKTVHAAMNTRARYVFVDECFTQPLGVLPLLKHFTNCEKLYVTGSTAQIGPIDKNSMLAGTRQLCDVLCDINLNSLRMPQDITRLVTGLHKQNITSCSDVSRSVIAYDCDDKRASQLIQTLKWPVMYFNKIPAKINNAKTIHDLQGFTKDRVILHIDEAATVSDLNTQFQHVVVALTRHTQYLVLVGRVNAFTRALYYENTAFERNDHMFKQGLADFHGKVPRDIRPRLAAVEEQILFPTVDLTLAKTLVDHAIKVKTQDDNEAAIQNVDSDKPTTGHLIAKVNDFMAKHKAHIKGKQLDCHRLTRRYLPGPFGESKCMVNRYSSYTKNGDEFKTTVQLLEGLATWCKDFTQLPLILPAHDVMPQWMHDVMLHASPQAIGMLTRLHQLTIEAIGGDSIDSLRNYFVTEYAKNLQDKGLPADNDKDFEIQEFRRYVSFFVKKQVKPDVRNYADERDKVHQGIAGWKKYQNFIFCSYTRLFTSLVQQLFKDNVLFASNESDSEIASRAAHFIAKAEDEGKSYKCMAIDFAEFDSRVVSAGPRLNALLMYFMFSPSLLCAEYLEQRGKWVLDTGILKLFGFDKMHSGEPWTLMGNTIYNMAVIGAVFIVDDLIVSGFKGDDSGIMASEIKYRNRDFEREHGIELKIDTTRSLEFTGIIWNRYGGMPDVIRRATKFLTTVYPDKKAYELSVINLKAELAILHTNAGFNAGCAQLADYYNEIGRIEPINADLVRNLAGFCYHQSFKTYESLLDFNKNVMQFSHGKLLTNQQ